MIGWVACQNEMVDLERYMLDGRGFSVANATVVVFLLIFIITINGI